MSKQNKDETEVGNKVKKYSLEIREDSIVESVKKEWSNRSKDGQFKYGTTLEENNHDDFLQHLKEELMDATLYIAKLQTQLNKLNK